MAGGSYEFLLADVGEGLHEAEVRRWLVRPGDRVALDQPLVEIETDKAVVELPSPVAGVVARLGAEEGAILHVGEIVAVLEPDAAGSAPAPAPAATARASPAEAGGSAAQSPDLSAHHSTRALATPAVRKLARDLGVEIGAVSGSGPGGRVLAADVQAFAGGAGGRERAGATGLTVAALPPAAGDGRTEDDDEEERSPFDVIARMRLPPPFPPPPIPETTAGTPAGDTRVPLRGLRRRIAQTMTQAWSTIPHITGFDEVEVSALVALRERLNARAGADDARLTYLPFVVKAAAIVLREYPIVNASLDTEREEIVLRAEAGIGIATATPDGLIVPVLRDAGGMTLAQVQRAIDAITERARARASTPEELRGGTFTITNFGALGGWQAAPIIRPGEAAILGVGRIQLRPWVVDGRIEPRPVLPLSLAADHRLIDGDVSTAFLTRVGALLSEPGLILLEMR